MGASRGPTAEEGKIRAKYFMQKGVLAEGVPSGGAATAAWGGGERRNWISITWGLSQMLIIQQTAFVAGGKGQGQEDLKRIKYGDK